MHRDKKDAFLLIEKREKPDLRLTSKEISYFIYLRRIPNVLSFVLSFWPWIAHLHEVIRAGVTILN